MSYPAFTPPIDAVGSATDAVRRYCGWHVAPVVAGDPVVVRGHRDASLMLPTLALLEVSGLEVDQANGEGFVTVDTTGLSPSRDGIVKRRGGWGSTLWRWRVTITHGFDAATEVGQLVADVAARAASSPAGHTQVTVGGVTTVNAEVAPGVSGGVVLMEHEREMLDGYRLPGLSR